MSALHWYSLGAAFFVGMYVDMWLDDTAPATELLAAIPVAALWPLLVVFWASPVPWQRAVLRKFHL